MGRRKKIKPEDKRIEMSIPEFLNFRALAVKKNIMFMCDFNKGNYIVDCKDPNFMLQIGY
jgi:hypothetical protein